jgi:uracil phosphoribosyltransferase
MFVLSQQPSIGNHFIAELRDMQIQKDSMRFRRNMERLGELLAYEISKTLIYESAAVDTPLGKCATSLLINQPVLATVLRAGLPMYQGFMHYFDKAESAFIGAYRSPHKADYSFEIELSYIVTPKLADKALILIDPMLATGKSIVRAYQAMLQFGSPAQIYIASAIASTAGVAYVQQQLPDCRLWLGAIDEDLNDKAYIVPGLGDAGDLAFGEKL